MKLLINEFVKDYKKKTTWLYMLLMFLVIIAYNFYLYKAVGVDSFDAVSSLAGITEISVGLGGILILIMFANNLSQEYSKGTVKFLYTKPKSRSAILTAKIVLAILNYFIFVIVGAIFEYIIKNYVFFKGKMDLGKLNETIADGYFGRTVLNQLIISNLASLAVMIFYISMVLLVCVVFKTQILSLVLVMFAVLGGSIIQGITALAVQKWSWIKYHMFDVNLFGRYYNRESMRDLVKSVYKFDDVNALLIMLVAYTAIFLIISYIINARRDITID
ncbi:ABC transporter permease [Gemella bergeri]